MNYLATKAINQFGHDCYEARGHVNGYRVLGFGLTESDAVIDAVRRARSRQEAERKWHELLASGDPLATAIEAHKRKYIPNRLG